MLGITSASNIRGKVEEWLPNPFFFFLAETFFSLCIKVLTVRIKEKQVIKVKMICMYLL